MTETDGKPVDTTPSHEQIDSGALGASQLSSTEVERILAIENRLREAQWSDRNFKDHQYLFKAQDRHSRVLLLDGGRGTGKTALLVTMADWWNEPTLKNYTTANTSISAVRAEKNSAFKDSMTPEHVRVLNILDFDPLPPQMPLIAGLVEAWRPIAEHIDASLASLVHAETVDDGGEVMDRWHQLFRMAATGWTSVSIGHGLIEQVLDRQEQVRDWQHLGRRWQQFIDELLTAGKNLPNHQERLRDDQVFVIMIDDVDLQVERVRELLPALRLLYHPRVFFVVAADLNHMVDMLKLDFLGKQQQLSQFQRTDEPLKASDEDRWASTLARSAFEKVFARRNRFPLRPLTVGEFLAYPGPRTHTVPPDSPAAPLPNSFRAELEKIKNTPPSNVIPPIKIESAAAFINNFAMQTADMLPGVATYRAVEQLRQHALVPARSTSPLEILAGLLTVDPAAYPVVTDSAVELPIAGTISALFQTESTELTAVSAMVFSGRPDFVFEPRGLERPASGAPTRMSLDTSQRFGHTQALIAKAMQEAFFPVSAHGLRWDTYLSLAWSEWSSTTGWTPDPLLFGWTRHTHPRPDQLLDQAREWQFFVGGAAMETSKDRRELAAYAWVYYQWKWSFNEAPAGSDPSEIGSEADLDQHWTNLLGETSKKDSSRWQQVTLPLLARPEIGFSPKVQRRLLQWVADMNGHEGLAAKEELRRQREALVTDAWIAARAQQGQYQPEVPADSVIRGYIGMIDQRYLNSQQTNVWAEVTNSGIGFAQ